MFSCYGQLHVMSGECQELLPEDARKGHVNGLCGGAVSGGLFMTVGIHTGDIPITVELYEKAPPLDDAWDEIVETSCIFEEEPVYLFGWAGESSEELAMPPGQYRARFYAERFGDRDTRSEDEESEERYHLSMWPAPPRPDAILKQTGDAAAYWHNVAKEENAA